MITLNLLANALTLYFLWQIATDLSLGPWVGFAGLLFAVDPLVIRQSTLVMTEPLFSALFLGAIFGWMRMGRAVKQGYIIPLSVGLAIGLAALTRPIAWLYFAAVGFLQAKDRRLRDWLFCAAVAGVVAAPWLIRNRLVLGSWILTTTHGGYTLWLGQNEVYYTDVVAGDQGIWPEASFRAWTEQNRVATLEMTEIEKDRYFRDQALEWMRGNPGKLLASMKHHVLSFWSLSPNYGPWWGRLACALLYGGVFGFAIVGLMERRFWQLPAALLPMALVVFTLCHAIYWSDMRMRTPLVPVIAILAAAGARRISSYLYPTLNPEFPEA